MLSNYGFSVSLIFTFLFKFSAAAMGYKLKVYRCNRDRAFARPKDLWCKYELYVISPISFTRTLVCLFYQHSTLYFLFQQTSFKSVRFQNACNFLLANVSLIRIVECSEFQKRSGSQCSFETPCDWNHCGTYKKEWKWCDAAYVFRLKARCNKSNFFLDFCRCAIEDCKVCLRKSFLLFWLSFW